MKTKSRFKKAAIAVLLYLTFGLNAKAQINDAYARIEESGSNFSCSFIVELSDTLNINQIEVALGSMPDSTNVTLKNFSFDAAPPSGCSYTRTGFNVVLGIGTLPERSTYYARARVNNSGTWTSYQFITN
jgi:hypothetical protein